MARPGGCGREGDEPAQSVHGRAPPGLYWRGSHETLARPSGEWPPLMEHYSLSLFGAHTAATLHNTARRDRRAPRHVGAPVRDSGRGRAAASRQQPLVVGG